MNKIQTILNACYEFLMHCKKNTLVIVLMFSSAINVVSFNPDLARSIYEDLDVLGRGTAISISKESQEYILHTTEANVFATFKFNYNIPKTMSLVDLLEHDISTNHIPSHNISVKGISELVISMMNDECYSTITTNNDAYSEYNTNGIKYITACPIVDEHSTLKGFSILMFKKDNSEHTAYYKSKLRQLNDTKRRRTWE